MKRGLLAFTAILALSFISVAWATPGNSPDDPIFISTPAELDAVRDGLNKHYKLSNDIDLTNYLASGGAGYAKWGAAGWLPIGEYNTRRLNSTFRGGLDGDGFKITGLWINRSSNHVGLFGYVVNADIKSLGIEIADRSVKGNNSVGGIAGYISSCNVTNCYVIGDVRGAEIVGGLAGYQYNSNITNCYATGSVSCGETVGGLVGFQYLRSTVVNSHATGSVSAFDRLVGGLVGYQSRNSSITNSYATGDVEGSAEIGGLVGSQASSSITNSYATGKVSSKGWYVGGLVGGQNRGSITNSYAIGEVSGNLSVGGLAGYQYQSVIMYSYSTGNAIGDYYVSGLVGGQESGYIKSGYATGNVGGGNHVGSLVGFQNGNSVNRITDSYRYQNSTVNGVVLSDDAPSGVHGGIKIAEELSTEATYSGNSWLFNDSAPAAGTWHWDERGFPKLNLGTEKFPFPWDPD